MSSGTATAIRDQTARQRVGIVTASRIVANYLSGLLTASGIICEVLDPGDFVHGANVPPSVVVHLSGPGDISLVHQVAASTVVLVGAGFDPAELLRIGVRAIVAEERTEKDLPAALRREDDGPVVISPTLVDALVGLTALQRAEVTAARQRVAHLGDRDRELLALIGAGRTNADIAALRCLSPSTVKAHVRDVLRRLGGCSRFEAAVLAFECGLVDSGGSRNGSSGLRDTT